MGNRTVVYVNRISRLNPQPFSSLCHITFSISSVLACLDSVLISIQIAERLDSALRISMGLEIYLVQLPLIQLPERLLLWSQIQPKVKPLRIHGRQNPMNQKSFLNPFYPRYFTVLN